MRSSAYTSPLHLDLEASKGFGVTTLITALGLVLYLLSIPRLDIVRVILPMEAPVDARSGKVATQVYLGEAGREASDRSNALRRTEPQIMQVSVPSDIPSDLGMKPGGIGGDWGADASNGTGSDKGTRFNAATVSGQDSAKSVVVDDEPFEFVQVEPTLDLGQLQRSIRYPEIAQRNGIQGSVMVKALIGPDGSVRRVEVIKSDNDILNEAALNGVRNATFTPGMQNGHAVSCWIYVPVNFRLQ